MAKADTRSAARSSNFNRRGGGRAPELRPVGKDGHSNIKRRNSDKAMGKNNSHAGKDLRTVRTGSNIRRRG